MTVLSTLAISAGLIGSVLASNTTSSAPVNMTNIPTSEEELRRFSFEFEDEYHLAPKGARTCDYGQPVSKSVCERAVSELASEAGKRPGRPLQVGRGGTCRRGWGAVPSECSAQTGGDWAAHYKIGADAGRGCVHEAYQLVCTNDVEWNQHRKMFGNEDTCEKLGHFTDITQEECRDLCTVRKGCNAINYAQREKMCDLRDCDTGAKPMRLHNKYRGEWLSDWGASKDTMAQYIGCYQNQHDARIDGHLYMTYDQCESRAMREGVKFFGFECPQCTDKPGVAQCLVMEDEFLKMSKRPDSECDLETDKGRFMGNAHRVAVYQMSHHLVGPAPAIGTPTAAPTTIPSVMPTPMPFPRARDTKLVRGNEFKRVDMGNGEFYLRFTVQPHGTVSGWSNVLHLTAHNDNIGRMGSRHPGVWFHSGTTKMHVCAGCDGNKNTCLNPSMELPLNRESDIAIHVAGGRLKVVLLTRGDAQVLSSTRCATPFDPRGATGVLYASDPWYTPANAAVSSIHYYA